MEIIWEDEKKEKEVTLGSLNVGDHFRFEEYKENGICRVIESLYSFDSAKKGMTIWLNEGTNKFVEGHNKCPVFPIKGVKLVIPEQD